MFYERRIGSLAALVSEAETMDADAGIRIVGRFTGHGCYAFVTRFGNKYTVMVYEKNAGRRDGLGRRLASEELEGVEELEAFLRRIASKRLEAFAY